MDINEVYQLVQFIFNKEQNGNITPTHFNLLVTRAQMSFINSRITPRIDEQGNKVGWQTDQTIRRELASILVLNELITVTAGVAAFPERYIDYDSMISSANSRLITECTSDEIAILNQSQIKAPSAVYPKFVQSTSGFHIYPSSITGIKLSYLQKPVDPFWAYTGDEVYDSANSEQLELPDITHFEIIMMILQPIGINLSLPEITQYAILKQKEGV